MQIALIGCSKKKKQTSIPISVKELYEGNLFKKSLVLARLMKFDEIFILSAKYGVLKPDDKILPYDETLKTFTQIQRKIWTKKVLEFLKEYKSDTFTYFCGKDYHQYLPSGKYFFNGLTGIGYINQKLNREIDKWTRKR